MVDVVTEPISVDAVLDAVRGPDCGGIVLFLGAVRNHADGRAVQRLDYQSYDDMARAEMERLIAEAMERWDARRCAIVHRKGTLEVGEVSIAVAAAAPHRADAFAAARYLIDALKQSVPVWKKEHYQDGESEWIQGA